MTIDDERPSKDLDREARTELRRYLDTVVAGVKIGRQYGRPVPFELRPILERPDGCLISLTDTGPSKVMSFDVTDTMLEMSLSVGRYYLLAISDGAVKNRIRFYLFETAGAEPIHLLFARAIDFPLGTYASSEGIDWVDLISVGEDAEESYMADENWRRMRGLAVTVPSPHI